MLARMPARVFHEWFAYDWVEPESLGRVEELLARLSWMYANAHRGKERQVPFKLEDFQMERYGANRTVRQKSQTQIYGLVKAWAILSGAKAKEVH